MAVRIPRPRRAPKPLALIFGAAALVLSSCAGADVDPATPDDVDERGEREDYEDAGERGDGRGWQWQGQRQDCFFVYENECHRYFDEACEAAGCSEADCEHDDAAPANVSCPEE